MPESERFDGSFELDNGAIITGGRFVEGGATLWLYFDTDNPAVGAAFQREEESAVFHSLPPYGGEAPNPNIELEFRAGENGHYDDLIWRQGGKEIKGRRVFAHTSTPVSFLSADGTRLYGRLLQPRCAAPNPAIVPVHGSGPVNRYGGTYHLFFVREGMSVLAYDKRGYTADRDAWEEPFIKDMASDAAAAVDFLAALPQVDNNRIGIMGSSQGGWTGPLAAEQADETDYMIMRAGAALKQTDTYVHEVRQEWRGRGLTGLDLDHAISFLEAVLALAEEGRPITDADVIAQPYRDAGWYREAVGEGSVSEEWGGDEWWNWAQHNMAVTPLPSLERSELPLLWMLGERDEAVPYVSTRIALEQAFARSPSDDETIVEIPNAPHSFIVEQADGSRILAPEFFSGMAEWLEERSFSDSDCWKTR